MKFIDTGGIVVVKSQDNIYIGSIRKYNKKWVFYSCEGNYWEMDDLLTISNFMRELK